MHVLLLPSWYPATRHDTAGIFFREQALALRNAGCAVGVIAPMYQSIRKFNPLRFFRERPTSLVEDQIPTIRVPVFHLPPVHLPLVDDLPLFTSLRDATLSNHYTRALSQHLNTYISRYGCPDVTHVHSLLPAGDLAAWAYHSLDIPYVITEHSSAFCRRLLTPAHLRRAAAISRHASCRIAVSTSLSAHLQNSFCADHTSWEVIPNLVADRFFAQRRPVRPPSREPPFVFLSVGHLHRNKRFDVLLNAFAEAFRDATNVSLRIGGDGPELQSLQSLARRLGLHNVTFLRALSRGEVFYEMQNAHAFALASDFETFSVVLVEALASGLPVISTDSGGPKDIVNSENGFLVSRGDSGEMARAMRWIVEHYSAFNRDDIRADCRKRFSATSVTSRLTDVYRRVIASRRQHSKAQG